jgi:uroporphyrinogen decarboxylase
MRQAGRYLPEYKEVRAQAGSFLDLCYNPELAAEVTIQPLRRFDFDAAIVFSDILVVPHAMGCDLSFVVNEGPQLSVVRNAAAVNALSDGLSSKQFASVGETLRRVKGKLPDHVSLIGFCGAPWTVASYMVEGAGSDRKQALDVARSSPDWFALLMERLVSTSIAYLTLQVESGAEVLQIFDSWAGDLDGDLRERWVLAPMRAIVDGLRAKGITVPVIAFARGIGNDHAAMARHVRPQAVGVEQGIRIADVAASLSGGVAVQGNLAPDLLVMGGESMLKAVDGICTSVPLDRHIFNLGHGILQETPIAHVEALVARVRQYDGAAGRV